MPWHILCDFDGAMSLTDTTDYLLERYAKPGWQPMACIISTAAFIA
jgi:2-hydroxy-3-keto-5-methylthiopentenyl-1-phosphate phosphatase